ncbi:MAG TPA: SEL1-like repeat protein [Asticcacaulis sp.]|nr:SEL1-like repeat protein [Asticcacaulis sp.]
MSGPGPVLAQSQTAVPAAQLDKASDTAHVTIFAQRKPRSRAQERIARMNPAQASSCQFGTSLTDLMIEGDPVKILALMMGDESAQNYFASMGIDDPYYGMELDPLDVGGAIDDISPISGDISAKMTAKEGKAGGCTAAEGAFTAGRNFIARHDQSMQQAFDALDAKDYPKALALFKEGYRKVGYPEAAFMIGRMYLAGMGTARDTKEAIVWFKRVTEAGFDARDVLAFNPADAYAKNARVESQIILANIYANGLDVPKSPKDARKWYAEAEKYGYVPADYILGKMAETGYGDVPDLVKAVAYYQKAGEYGFAPAQYELGQLYYNGADGVSQDKTKAGAWLLKAAKAGYPDALFAVARMYESGEGGASVDRPKALVYYKEAAVRGQTEAQVTLATYLYTGENGTPKNLETARKLFQVAAEQGNDPDAMFNLAVMLTNGEGGPKDLVRAYCWFYIADKGGVAKAKAALAELATKMTPEERAQAEALLNPPKTR